ncbi:MAG: restriction endonuclease subunit S, partial [Campylobacter sp.]|nr:restriction endonuclease subunit S [Campylobacter sp.]
MSSIEWGEFRIGDLFDISTSKSIDEGKLILSKIFSKDCIEFVGRTRENNGIKGYTKIIDKIKPNPSNTISISQVGTIAAQLRKNSWYASQNIFILKANDNQLINLFVVASINYVINAMFDDGYSNYPTLEKLITLKIQLPITASGEIDFDFMESFVAELEAYLAAASLKDYELTAAELSALSKFENYNWSEFRIGDLFEIKTPKKRFDANKIKFGGLYPYVVRTSTNNGIRGYITENIDFLNEKNTISFGQDTATTFYQKSEYFTGDKIKVFKLKDYELNSKIANFLISVMTKAFSNFSWGSSSFNVKVLNEVKILLPLNKNGEIDFEFMNNFIKAIKKLVIKDVVLYADNKIKATKSIV